MLPEEARRVSEINRDKFRIELLSKLLQKPEIKNIMNKIYAASNSGKFSIEIVGDEYDSLTSFDFDGYNLGSVMSALGYEIESIKPITPGEHGIRIKW